MYTKTKLFIAFLCLFAFFKSNGQKSLFLSEVRKEKTPATDVLLFKDYVYLLKVSRDRSGFSKKWYYHIQKINNDGQMELESKFQSQINNEKTRPTKIFGIGDDMYMLSKQGKSFGFMDFFLTKLEKESLVPTEEYIKLTNIKGKDWIPQSIVSSPKQKYLLFTLEIHAAKRKERKYQFILVGENLEIALDETISIPEQNHIYQYWFLEYRGYCDTLQNRKHLCNTLSLHHPLLKKFDNHNPYQSRTFPLKNG